ncbi:hypothetical protein B0T25DRAFT_540744 [Lasiosphaeria hispida]|uniref:Uncharacterized protein n=1 Tax=Lasiosphaeria hispida TaxID=260671 RepID=A0AAJ0HN84_9PEZI|nr:hypothetical protein B0T25DRAFT_540744 [Lasiosphaeria hispida]
MFQLLFITVVLFLFMASTIAAVNFFLEFGVWCLLTPTVTQYLMTLLCINTHMPTWLGLLSFVVLMAYTILVFPLVFSLLLYMRVPYALYESMPWILRENGQFLQLLALGSIAALYIICVYAIALVRLARRKKMYVS